MLKSRGRESKGRLPEGRRQAAKARPGSTRGRSDDGRSRIADRAYFIWLDKGRPAGQDLACWFEAEKELKPAASGSVAEEDDA